jgi:hypothetical protein
MCILNRKTILSDLCIPWFGLCCETGYCNLLFFQAMSVLLLGIPFLLHKAYISCLIIKVKTMFKAQVFVFYFYRTPWVVLNLCIFFCFMRIGVLTTTAFRVQFLNH